MKHLFLFDVDGVLVEARGYLRALQDTVAHFARRMGVGDPVLTEDEVRAGEAHGLTSEWDSAPTYILALFIERLRREPSLALPARWEDALATLAARPFALPHPDYITLVARAGARRRDFKETSHAVRSVLWDDAQALPVAQREVVGAILDELLADTHNFACAPITQYFQHLVIGNCVSIARGGCERQYSSGDLHRPAQPAAEWGGCIDEWILAGSGAGPDVGGAGRLASHRARSVAVAGGALWRAGRADGQAVTGAGIGCDRCGGGSGIRRPGSRVDLPRDG
jgi:phosphoglycolate phosphatase-like HAD superfamily hydrolase